MLAFALRATQKKRKKKKKKKKKIFLKTSKPITLGSVCGIGGRIFMARYILNKTRGKKHKEKLKPDTHKLEIQRIVI
jgi:hypothetical protein